MLIDLYRFLLEYLPIIIVALPVMYWLYREHRTQFQWRPVMIVIVVLAGVLTVLLFVAQFPVTTRYIWSGGRLAHAISWTKGYRLYYPAGEGPLLVQMYGPVSALLYAFAAIARTPTIAILLASACNHLRHIHGDGDLNEAYLCTRDPGIGPVVYLWREWARKFVAAARDGVVLGLSDCHAGIREDRRNLE